MVPLLAVVLKLEVPPTFKAAVSVILCLDITIKLPEIALKAGILIVGVLAIVTFAKPPVEVKLKVPLILLLVLLIKIEEPTPLAAKLALPPTVKTPGSVMLVLLVVTLKSPPILDVPKAIAEIVPLIVTLPASPAPRVVVNSKFPP